MSFERIKRIGNNDYLYEQESYRDKGEVKSRHVRYIGKLGTTYSGKKAVHVNSNNFHSVHESHINHDINPFDKKYEQFALNRHMIITIPSTQGKKHISQKEIDSRARDVASKMTEDFGGSTRIKGEGTYVNEKNTVDSEKVVKVEVFMSKEQWKKEQPKIQEYILSKQKKWNQETIGVEYDRSASMYFIRTPNKKKD